MHFPPSHWRQRHTGLIFLLESALGVLRHASSALPLPPAAHRAHLLAGEPTQGPQACIFRPPTGASGTQGSSSLLESAVGVLRHASSALPLPPAAHKAHLLAGERGSQASLPLPPAAHTAHACWRAPLGVLRHASSALPLPPAAGLSLLESALGVLRHALPPSHCRQLHTGLIFLPRPWGPQACIFRPPTAAAAAHLHTPLGLRHLLAAASESLLESPWGPQACIFRTPTAASCTQGSSSCWRAHPGSSGHLPHSHWRQRHSGLNFLQEPTQGPQHLLPLAPAAHRAHLLLESAVAGERHPAAHRVLRHASLPLRPPTAASCIFRTGLIFLLESPGSSGMHLPHSWHTGLNF